MTKEELEKEADEYSNNWKINKKANLNFAELVELRAVIYKAYLAGAEPREKRIAELEAQIEKVKCCTNCRHSRTEYEHCRTNKHEKWEIKENV